MSDDDEEPIVLELTPHEAKWLESTCGQIAAEYDDRPPRTIQQKLIYARLPKENG